MSNHLKGEKSVAENDWPYFKSAENFENRMHNRLKGEKFVAEGNALGRKTTWIKPYKDATNVLKFLIEARPFVMPPQGMNDMNDIPRASPSATNDQPFRLKTWIAHLMNVMSTSLECDTAALGCFLFPFGFIRLEFLQCSICATYVRLKKAKIFFMIFPRKYSLYIET
ncbi:hypothetical protein JXA32_08940 [Candidatus Sumerlaeota bacterium]|nr:hypothetical protein [Candidatus Sumerlaeota bacterium]